MRQGIGYYDNAERRSSFRDLLKAYDVYGYRARITSPYSAKGTIVEQRLSGPGAIFILELDEKIPFKEYAQSVGATDKRVQIRWEGETHTHSQKENLHDTFKRLGFLDDHDNITHLWAQWISIELIDLQKGQPVEYVESESSHVASIKSTPGIVNNVIIPDHPNAGQEIVELFLVHPVSWVRIPRSMDTDYLKPEHVSAWTDHLQRNTYLFWKEKSPNTLPKGNVTDDGREYVLDEPIPLNDVKSICASGLTDTTVNLRCWLAGAMFHIVPIVVNHGGTFRPMRMEVARDSIPYIVTRKDVDDAMKRGEHFEQNPVYPEQWPDEDFYEGDRVVVTAGPFINYVGFIVGYDDHSNKFIVQFGDGHRNEEWPISAGHLRRTQ